MKKLLLLFGILLASACFAQQPVQGTKTNNNAAPGATNLGVLPCLANASAPSFSEGDLVTCSVDLSGNLRILLSGTTVTVAGNKTNNNAAPGATNVGALTCIANAAAPTNTEGDQTLCSQDLTGNQRITTQATADITNSALQCIIVSAVSTNSTNCKNAAGNEYGYELYNTTTTVYYLRIYNSSSAPTCSSATGFIRSIPVVPAGAAGGVGGQISNFDVPLGFSTGISFCLTGGSSSTDNTNAAVGIFGTIRYK